MRPTNPFRIHGTVTGEYFTDREAELAAFKRILLEPAAKMVVYGDRRTGKSSTLEAAVTEINEAGGHAIIADLSTATTLTDVGNRILEGSAKSLGKRWNTIFGNLIGRFQGSIKFNTDPVTGIPVPSFDVSLRDAPIETQSTSLGQVLDTIDALAAERKIHIGIVLDEFQEISEIGGERAEWNLRGIVQKHQHISYIFAGSKPHVIRRMLGKNRAFYQLADEYPFGPIDAYHMATWIEERMRSVGLGPFGVGVECVRIAGPRTRDIVALARKCADRSMPGQEITTEAVHDAFVELLDEKDDGIRAWWDSLTQIQQNLLRAVAASPKGLTTKSTLKRFSLPSSGSATNTAKALVDDGRLVKVKSGSGYVFDSPFDRGWVILHTLPDIGMTLSPTFKASEGDGAP